MLLSILLSCFIFFASVTDTYFRGQGFQMQVERLLRKSSVIFKATQKIQLFLKSVEVGDSVAVRSSSSLGEEGTGVYPCAFDHWPCVYFSARGMQSRLHSAFGVPLAWQIL